MASKAVGKIKAISSKFKWQINDFCTCCDKNVGEVLDSPKFIASSVSSDIQWYLSLYPRGHAEDSKDYLSLYLNANKQATAAIKFKILNSKFEVVFTYTLEETTFGKESWGTDKLISRDYVLNPANFMLTNGNMTILCEITTMPRFKVKESITASDKELEPALLARLEILDHLYEDLFLKNSKFTDLSLISDSKTVKVHKCILAKSSPVFAAMFDAEMKENQENTVEIADIKYDVLQEMLRFIYTGKVNRIDKLVSELAIAADKYALHRLKNMCENTMIKNFRIDNVVACLLLADTISIDMVKEKAIEFIVENASDITDKPDFKLLPYDIVCKVCCVLAKRNK